MFYFSTSSVYKDDPIHSLNKLVYFFKVLTLQPEYLNLLTQFFITLKNNIRNLTEMIQYFLNDEKTPISCFLLRVVTSESCDRLEFDETNNLFFPQLSDLHVCRSFPVMTRCSYVSALPAASDSLFCSGLLHHTLSASSWKRVGRSRRRERQEQEKPLALESVSGRAASG